ncbi:MAG: hypothetical protein MZV70_04075 [Desulfobacterales bacterium]|nr:hypothetical protein [Desulfobacterales bacterium]
MPPFTLLEEAPQKDTRVKRDHLITNSRILEKKLADFGVEARVVEVMPGPVITMYELEPAARCQDQPHHQSGRRSGPGADGAQHPHSRADSRQIRHRH